MSPLLLSIDHVSKRFGAVRALDDVSLDIAEGEIVAILGPSGSGKSTLIRCVHQLETIDSGAIYLRGEMLGVERRGDHLVPLPERRVAQQRSRMGMVFQQFNLFHHFTVLENVIEGPTRVKGARVTVAKDRARQLLASVRLSDKADSYPGHLSGGQQQRAAIARALANEPEIMLFDEPTSALDPELVGEVLEVIRQVAALGTTMVVVTHEMAFARDVASRVIFMDHGKVVADGKTEEIFGSAPDTRVGAFLVRSLRPADPGTRSWNT
jgi:ABC-type polar amino acid transport system ATPase subunit